MNKSALSLNGYTVQYNNCAVHGFNEAAVIKHVDKNLNNITKAINSFVNVRKLF